METYIYNCSRVPERLSLGYQALLNSCSLRDEGDSEMTVLLLDEDERICACGSLRGNVIKQVAVDPALEGEGLCAQVLSELVGAATRAGHSHLFLYTKPRHRQLFSAMGFSAIAETDDVLFMENRKAGLESYLAALPRYSGIVGAIVCNCNPFTLGHQALVRHAAANCDELFVFVLSEDSSEMFPAEDRLELVKKGTAELKNVHVLPSGPYMISQATFPAYFLKETADVVAVRCELDLAVFGQRIAPALNISRRFCGQEPFDSVTAEYNRMMKAILPAYDIELHEIPRFQNISASQVRKAIKEGRLEDIKALLPDGSYEYCASKFG